MWTRATFIILFHHYTFESWVFYLPLSQGHIHYYSHASYNTLPYLSYSSKFDKKEVNESDFNLMIIFNLLFFLKK